MPEEYLDIVDEEDHVIGSDTREKVHAAHAIHRGIHIFIINRRGEILVQQRSLSKDYYPGYLDISVGAQVSSGESYEQAALRELREELGVEVSGLIRIGDYNSYSSRQREKRRVFLLAAEGPFTLQSDEVERIEFMSVQAISENLSRETYTEGFKKSFAIYLDYLGIGSTPAPPE